MTLHFASGDVLHRHLVKFTLQSRRSVTDGTTEYSVLHSQFGTYDIQDAFETLLKETDGHPQHDDEFPTQAAEAITDSNACLADRDLHHHYDDREYLTPQEVRSRATDYQLYATELQAGKLPQDCVQPRAVSRPEAIAEVLTLLHAERAGDTADFELDPLLNDDAENPPVDSAPENQDIKFALRQTTATLHGPATFTRPDPNLHTVRTLYHIYDEVDIMPSVRAVYGFFVTPQSPRFYERRDPLHRQVASTIGDLQRSAAGLDTPDQGRWESEAEPPAKSDDH